MQTSTGWLQDILESVSLQEIYAFPCSLLSFVLCMDFYWNSSVRTKTAGAAEVIYKKMCMLLTSHTHTQPNTHWEMKSTMRWSEKRPPSLPPQKESLTSSRRRQTRTLKKCWKFYSYSCGPVPRIHTHTGDICIYMCIYIYLQYANSKHTGRRTHTLAHMIAWQNCPYTLPSGGCLPTTSPSWPGARHPAPSCPASPKVHVIGLTNAICLGSRDWSRQRNVIICAHNYICLYCMHKRTNRPRIDGVSHLEPTQLRRVHVRIGSLHSHIHTHTHVEWGRDRHGQTPPSARTKAFPISGVHT